MKNLFKLIEMIKSANARDIKLHVTETQIILKAVAQDYSFLRICWDINGNKLEFESAFDSIDQEHTRFGECVKAVFNIDSEVFIDEVN